MPRPFFLLLVAKLTTFPDKWLNELYYQFGVYKRATEKSKKYTLKCIQIATACSTLSILYCHTFIFTYMSQRFVYGSHTLTIQRKTHQQKVLFFSCKINVVNSIVCNINCAREYFCFLTHQAWINHWLSQTRNSLSLDESHELWVISKQNMWFSQRNT